MPIFMDVELSWFLGVLLFVPAVLLPIYLYLGDRLIYRISALVLVIAGFYLRGVFVPFIQ